MPTSLPLTGKRAIGFSLLLFAIVLALLPWFGAEPLCGSAVWSHVTGVERTAHGLILFHQRIPRILLALGVGGALSLTGATLQVLFRNPLAEPWTLGVAGGAAVGVFAAQALPMPALAAGPFTTTQILALSGAAAAMGLVGLFARRTDAMAPQALLLAGVTISIVAGGVIMLIGHMVAPYEFMALHRWMMGGLDVIGYRELGSLLLLGTPGLCLLLSQAREYNHLAFNEDVALGHGVDVARVRRLTFLGAGITTAACVAVAGPIGFVGMMAPHLARRLCGFDYRVVLPCSFLLGGSALALCDGLARTVAAPTEIPVGIITAVLGGPIFLYSLAQRPS